MASVGAQFGEELRSERERRGISLEMLCARTKVNRRHLDALERGDYQALPGGVFRRGFVRAYLGSLGLEEQLWMARFDTCYADYARSVGVKPEADDDAWATFATNVKRNRGVPRRRNLGRWLGVLAMLILLAAAAWSVWHFVLQGHSP
jgi:cytoskeleton protein RodZ